MVRQLKLNKKILFVSSWAPPSLGGPQSLYNLLVNYYPEDYFILTSLGNSKKYARYTGEKLPCQYYFYDDRKTVKNSLDHYFFLKIWKRFKKLLLGIRVGTEAVEAQKVGLLVGVSDSGFALLLTYILSGIKKLPYIIFLFDLYRGNRFSFFKNLFKRFFEPVLFRGSKGLVVTNEETKRYVKERYDYINKITVVHNSVFAEPYKYLGIRSNSGKRHKIIYTGKIYWPQRESVKTALKAFCKMGGKNLRFILYSPDADAKLRSMFRADRRVSFRVANQSRMPKIQRGASILFLPFTFEKKARDIVRTASPAKLTEYLAAGKPILIYAPRYSFVGQYARRHRFAHIVDREDQKLIIQGIEKILSDKNYSRRLGKNAKKLFYRNHEARKNSLKLFKVLNRSY